jgi:hypothetical protein
MPVNLGQPFVGVGPDHTSGPVPDPGTHNDSEAYLRCDGKWANPGVGQLQQRFNSLVIWLLASGFALPPDIVDGL